MANQEEIDRSAFQSALVERVVGFKHNLSKVARAYHARVMASREAIITYQQQKLKRLDLAQSTYSINFVNTSGDSDTLGKVILESLYSNYASWRLTFPTVDLTSFTTKTYVDTCLTYRSQIGILIA